MESGFHDSYRQLYPDKAGAYSWWSYRANARANNIGWRIDYFGVSSGLLGRVKDAAILSNTPDREIRRQWIQRILDHDGYEITAPDGTVFERALGFGGGGKTVDNTNKSAGVTLSWTPTDNQSVLFDYDTSEQVYDNTPYINNLGTETYPLGTVDGLAGIWRAAPPTI